MGRKRPLMTITYCHMGHWHLFNFVLPKHHLMDVSGGEMVVQSRGGHFGAQELPMAMPLTLTSASAMVPLPVRIGS